MALGAVLNVAWINWDAASAGYVPAQTSVGVWSEFVLLIAMTAAGLFTGFEIVRRIGLKLWTRKTPPQGAAGLSQTRSDRA